MVRLIASPINRAGTCLAAWGLHANTITLLGFGIGMGALPALIYNQYSLALGFILLNRLADGLDGAVARASTKTDFGAYLDIVLDFIFYGTVVLGFAVAKPEVAAIAAALLVSFIGTGTSFLAYAIIAAKRGVETQDRGKKFFFYSGGLAEGTETILFFVIICVWPNLFAFASWVFMIMCWITVVMRIAQAHRAFSVGAQGGE